MHNLVHISKRKRNTIKELENYPSKKFWIRFLDRIVLVAAVLGPAFTLPQIFQTYMTKNVSGISAITWFSWFFLSMVWLSYGIVHKERPIIITQILWFMMHLLMIIAILMFS